jgi:hypothetical protein
VKARRAIYIYVGNMSRLSFSGVEHVCNTSWISSDLKVYIYNNKKFLCVCSSTGGRCLNKVSCGSTWYISLTISLVTRGLNILPTVMCRLRPSPLQLICYWIEKKKQQAVAEFNLGSIFPFVVVRTKSAAVFLIIKRFLWVIYHLSVNEFSIRQ